MKVSEYTKKIVTLNDNEREAVETIAKIVDDFADQNLCQNIQHCDSCPLIMFCPFTEQAKDFEETLNDIANLN